MRVVVLALSMAFLLSHQLAVGGVIRGVILDAKTGEALPGATVRIDGSYTGAMADDHGFYLLRGLTPGAYTLLVQCISYQAQRHQVRLVKTSDTLVANFQLTPESLEVEEVQVVTHVSKEGERLLLAEQKKSVVPVMALGAQELSRKGLGDAQDALAQMAGISKQEGMKNVFVRGLGDRYNVTMLNGFPIPSEDPEYKNVALDFFTSDIIQNIGVSKVFTGERNGDVGGAIVDVTSKELFQPYLFSLSAGAGFNASVWGHKVLRQDAANYWGCTQQALPTENGYLFKNSLNPKIIALPLNHSYGLSGGYRWTFGGGKHSLSAMAVATNSVESSFTKSAVRNAVITPNGNFSLYQDQEGTKSSHGASQVAMANATLRLGGGYVVAYNLFFIHSTNLSVNDLSGLHSERYQASPSNHGIMRRQQANDNLLLTNQLLATVPVAQHLTLDAGIGHDIVKGDEPDRRENDWVKMATNYVFNSSDRQKRSFSSLDSKGLSARLEVKYELPDHYRMGRSFLKVGYVANGMRNDFWAREYSFGAIDGVSMALEQPTLELDGFYNYDRRADYTLHKSSLATYSVRKWLHTGYLDLSYQPWKPLTLSFGLRVDKVNLAVDYHTDATGTGQETIDTLYALPALNIRADLGEKHTLRLGASTSYTLPQAKEIAPYQYVTVGLTSQGNAKLKPSINYNLDLRWDFFIAPSGYLALTGFYKHILRPIARVDKGNSAGLLEYDNVSAKAEVAGVELEFRYDLLNRTTTALGLAHKLTLGFNASYIYTTHEVMLDTRHNRASAMEGAAPWIVNADLSYSLRGEHVELAPTLLFGYFGTRIHTIGTKGYNNIMEKGAPRLDLQIALKLYKHWTLKLKAKNLLDPAHQLTRVFPGQARPYILEEYRRGRSFSLGLSYAL